MPSVSVCFPAYNEEATIESVLREAHELLSRSGLEYEILVCDDGSADRTGSIAEELARSLPLIRVLRNPKNCGIRQTFERLYRESRKDLVFLNSTDRQWDTRVLFDLLPLTDQFDIVIASRKRKHYGLTRGIVSGLFNFIPRVLFGVKTHDAGAVKLVRREIIERFELVSRSPFSEAERLIRAERAGYRIASHPVDIAERLSGKARGVTFHAVTEAGKDVFRVWLALKRESRKSRSDASR
ncbi:MAG TPA: glycosyltransferase family 2 protein [Blastocatellia bacterium]|nr:glycosyltransferase family 2 protein [Blastocatellia bacterium]